MHFKTYHLLLSFFFLFLLGAPGIGQAGVGGATSTVSSPKPIYTGVFYYRESERAFTSLQNNYRSISVLAPQSYLLNSSGTLKGSVQTSTLDFARSKGIRIMPLVTNGSFSRTQVHAFLDDLVAQDRAVEAMVLEAKKQNYWGWQIDFEQIDATYRDKFSAFMSRVNDSFRNHNLVVSVAVIAQISENPADYKEGLWHKVIGVYDYKALGQTADFVSIMSYDDPASKGPVAGYPWMKKVVEHTVRLIPPEKVSLGLPLYYWLWNDTKGKRIEIGGYKGIMQAYDKHYVTTSYSKAEETAYLSYRSYYNNYKLWYDNGKSVTKKLELVKNNNLHGFSAWALGLEVPSVHPVFQKFL